MDWARARRGRTTQQHALSGGVLRVPRTPVEKIMLSAKLKRLKLDAEKRRKAS